MSIFNFFSPWFILIFPQPGEPRTSLETRATILEQYKAAASGSGTTSGLKKLVTATGTKDTLAQPLIDLLIRRSSELREAQHPDNSSRPAYTTDEIQDILAAELSSRAETGISNPNLQMKGMLLEYFMEDV